MNHRSANLPEFSLPSPPSTHRADWIQPASAVPRRRGATFHFPRRRASFTDYPDTTRTSTQRPNRGTPPPHTIPVRRSDQSRRRRRRRGSPPAEIHRRGSVTRGGIAIPCCYASDGGGHSSGAAAAEEWRGRGDAKEVGNGESGKEEIVCLGDSEKKVNPFLSTLFFFTPLLLLFFSPLVIFRFYLFLFGDCSALCFVYIRQIHFVCFFLSFFFARRNLFSFFHI